MAVILQPEQYREKISYHSQTHGVVLTNFLISTLLKMQIVCIYYVNNLA